MLVFDTNVLVYAGRGLAVPRCLPRYDFAGSREWIGIIRHVECICYEFLRVTTHANAPTSPWSLLSALDYLATLLSSPGFQVLTATAGHARVFAQTASEHPDARGNLAHDLHAAVILREHGISRIYTRDTDSRRFPFMNVVAPQSGPIDD